MEKIEKKNCVPDGVLCNYYRMRGKGERGIDSLRYRHKMHAKITREERIAERSEMMMMLFHRIIVIRSPLK